MRYVYHMGYGYYGPIIMTVILLIAIVILLVVIIGSRNNSNAQIQAPLDLLGVRYAKGEISSEEYREKKSLIESEKHPNQATIILMERYVNGEISKDEYIRMKKEIS
jgi:Predicted membrane protein